MRLRHRTALAAAAVLACQTPASGQAQTTGVVTVKVARGGLAAALRAFALQSGCEISFSPEIARGKTANRVVGRMPVTEALRRLLTGTGLVYRTTRTGFSIAVAPPSPPVAPPPHRALAPVVTAGMPDGDILVLGTRLEGGSAIDVKRRLLQSASILTAADVERIPDTSLADTVRRIPGVQISASGGGAIVTIRGLTQVESRINGRNLASTVGRSYDIGALPSDIVSGVDVYKTPSASQIEGGIGGVIDFHTRRPFDFSGAALGANLKASYVDLADNVRPFVSGYVSDRRQIGGDEVGLLLGGSYQRQAITQHVFRVDGNAIRVVDGANVDAPENATKRHLGGYKELVTGYASAQWRHGSSLELTGDFLYNRANLDFTNTSLTADLRGASPVAIETYGGSNAVAGGLFARVPLTSATSRGMGYFETYQTGLNGRYGHGALTVTGELSYTYTDFEYAAPGATLTTLAPSLAFAGAAALPRFSVDGIDAADRAAWRPGTFSQIAADQSSAEWAYRLDAVYAVGGWIEKIKAGVRYDRRTVDNRFVSTMTDAPGLSVAPASLVGRTDGFLFGRRYPQPQWLAVTPSALRPSNLDRTRLGYGAPSGAPLFDPARAFDAVERIYDAYAELTFGLTVAGLAVDGDAGLRYARTALSVTGARDLPGGGLERVTTRQGYHDWLPSVNLRVALIPERLFLRLAFSKQITRPSFTQLAPTTTLDFVDATGSAGNPALGPLRADQYDAALEWYPAPNGNLYLAGFYKDVSGFVRSQVTPEVIGGRTFLVTRPQDLGRGWIGGLEAGYQHRFTFLPGVLAGLGAQASYTYVDSAETENGAGYRTAYQQLSRHNWTLAVTYDRHRLAGALNWVWRGRLVEAASGDQIGRPLYRNPYGQLDALVTYALSPAVSVTASAINALRRRTIEYFGDQRFLNQVFVEDRRFFLGFLFKLGAAT